MELLRKVKTASEKKGLLLNTKKTKVMIIEDQQTDLDAFFSLDGNVIEVVERFEFLGSIINTKGDCSQEIRRRLAMARNIVQSMSKLWKTNLPSTLKVRLLKSTAFAVATYGSESWTLKLADSKRLDSFELWCYRRVLRIPWTARKSNTWILEELGIQKTL